MAEKIGIKEIELDVWFSKDNHIVICHDGSLDRYGYPGLHVTELDLEALLKLDMGSWFSPHLFSGERMLTLEVLFTLFRDRFVYHVEIKEPLPGLVRKLLATVNAHHLENRVIITSKHINCLISAKTAAPLIRTGWILTKGSFLMENIDQAANVGLFQICPPAEETNETLVEAAHTKLPEVRAYGVTGIEAALQAINSGCDGFTINWPDWFVHQTNN